MAQALLGSGSAIDLTVITRPELIEETESLGGGPGQVVRAIAPTPELPALARQADLVVAAAGSMSWELLAVGAASALMPIVGNQERNHARLVRLGAVHPLVGRDAFLARPDATAADILGLLDRPADLSTLRERALAAVDGRGAERVARAVLALAAR
jgi:UDP-N-acetylglucosamine:LPS N-acetylglucosamine transferase